MLRRMNVPPHLVPRATTLLLLTPPALGATLGGALAHFVSIAIFDASTEVPDVRISIGLAIFSVLVLGSICLRSYRVHQGSPSTFPRLFRVAPATMLAGLVLGLYAALRVP